MSNECILLQLSIFHLYFKYWIYQEQEAETNVGTTSPSLENAKQNTMVVDANTDPVDHIGYHFTVLNVNQQ
jgi:hypothetical protein